MSIQLIFEKDDMTHNDIRPVYWQKLLFVIEYPTTGFLPILDSAQLGFGIMRVNTLCNVALAVSTTMPGGENEIAVQL
jgi:hypothetical protein